MRAPTPIHRIDRFAAIIAAILLLIAFLANQAAVHDRTNIVDSYLFEYHGWCLAQGATPYVDFWDNKPPAIWLVNALAFRVLGEHGWSGHVPAAIALGLSLAAFVFVSRALFGSPVVLPAALIGGALLAHIGFECGANRTETYVVACELLGVAAYLLAMQKSGRGRDRPAMFVLAGLLLGLAPWFKQVGIAALLACSVHLSWQSPFAARRIGLRLGAVWLGAAVPAMAIGVWLLTANALEEGIFAIGRFNRAYFAAGDATWTDLPRTFSDYRAVFPLLTAPLLLAVVGMVVPRGGVDARAGSHGVCANVPYARLLLGVWLLLSAYLANVAVGRVSHHLMPTLPPLALLALRGAAWLTKDGLAVALQTPARLLGFVLFTAACGQIAAQSLHSGGWIGPAQGLGRPARNPGIANQIAQGRAIAALCAPDEPVYVWGWAPGAYRYAYRLPSTRFATLEKVYPLRPHAAFIEDEARAALVRSPPRIFAASRSDFTALGAADTPLTALLRDRYRIATEIDALVILMRHDAPASRAANEGAEEP